jgi:hypothetical protein
LWPPSCLGFDQEAASSAAVLKLYDGQNAPHGGFCHLGPRTDLQFLEEALPLFANLVVSPTVLMGNGATRAASR